MVMVTGGPARPLTPASEYWQLLFYLGRSLPLASAKFPAFDRHPASARRCPSRIARLKSLNDSVRINDAGPAGTEAIRLTDLVVVFGLDNFLATIKAVRADMVAQVYFTGRGFYGQRRISGPVVGATHVALRGGTLVLLDSHLFSTTGKM